MIIMEFKELQNKTEGELHRLLSDSRNDLREMRFKDAGKQLKNVRAIRVLKKLSARVLTMLNAKKRVHPEATPAQSVDIK